METPRELEQVSTEVVQFAKAIEWPSDRRPAMAWVEVRKLQELLDQCKVQAGLLEVAKERISNLTDQQTREREALTSQHNERLTFGLKSKV